MIGKITTGSNFRPLMFYLLKKEKNPRIIGGNMLTRTAHHLAKEFTNQAELRPTTRKPVKHYAIAFAPSDGRLDDLKKHQVASDIVRGMGFAHDADSGDKIKGVINTQYLVVHHDRHDPSHDEDHQHDHIHIVVNLIDFDGERVNDGWDKRRLEKVLRDLERKYRLKQITSSIDYARQRSDKTDASNDSKVKKPLQYLLKQLQEQMLDNPAFDLLKERLKKLGITIKRTPPCFKGGKYRFEYTVGNYSFSKSSFRNESDLIVANTKQNNAPIYTVDLKAQSLLRTIKSKIASAVKKNTSDKPSFSLFVQRMKNDDIEVILYHTAGKKRSGRFKIKYRYQDGIAIRAGAQLGGSLTNLINQGKLVFDPEDWARSISEKASLDSPEKVETKSFLSQQIQSTKRARRQPKKSQLER